MRISQFLSLVLAAAALLAATSRPSCAGVIVNFDAQHSVVNVGDEFTVSIVADMSLGVLGWGMLFTIQNAEVVSLVNAPHTSMLWFNATTLTEDGWQIGALAFPEPVSGVDVLLATITLQAHAIGESDLILSIDENNLTQGFALAPPFPAGTFDAYTINLGHVSVVPTPGIVSLGCLLLVTGHRRRPRVENPCTSQRITRGSQK